ncbi:hypothetical protein R5R35_003659 [Gryllus longicercus]|uniref:Uncharacterized protein n=1 Tax=Gryllus longicercus TaxID=2509291 RepID=A0AAN9W2P5_9ORTH
MRFACEAALRSGEAEADVEAEARAELDFLLDVPSHYFKSSFARAVLSDSQAPRSLDAGAGAGARGLAGRRSQQQQQQQRQRQAPAPPPPTTPQDEDDDDEDAVQLQAPPRGAPRAQTSELARIWKLRQSPPPPPPPPPPLDRPRRSAEAASEPPPPPRASSSPAPAPASAAHPQRLRKECRGPRCSGAGVGGMASPRDASALVDAARLQSQVDTLAWQLKQTEASRQTYRRVMEQVVVFLERTHKSLDNLRHSSTPNGSTHINGSTPNCRVPRSRSVHTVDVSPSRASPRSESAIRFPRAKSIAQIEETQSYSTFRDFTWRRPRKANINPDCVPPEKLSEESFRLLRLVQSLLNVQEPDLTLRISAVSDRVSVTSSVTDHMPDTLYTNSISQRSSTASSGFDMADDKGSVLELNSFNKKLLKHDSPTSLSLSCSSPVPSTCNRSHTSDTISIHSINSTSSKTLECKNTALTSGLESGFAGHTNYSRKSSNFTPLKLDKDTELSNGYPTNGTSLKQQLSEDESGFSSMSSFQEVGVPIITPPLLPSSPPPSGSYQEVGLPLIESQTPNNSGNHRRWSSTPVTGETQFPQPSRSFCLPGESWKVLWV